MLSHYLRANTWPQKFLPESSSLGLGQFSVFSVIGVGQPPCASIQILRRATREAFPRAVVSPKYRTTQAFLTTIANLETLSNMAPIVPMCVEVSLRSSREQDVLQYAKPESL